MTKQVKHTPGPWFFSKLQGLTISAPTNVIGAIETSICTWHTTEKSEQEDLANARLIAAAPEMLEALTSLMEHAPEINSILGDEAYQKIITVINKAGGSES